MGANTSGIPTEHSFVKITFFTRFLRDFYAILGGTPPFSGKVDLVAPKTALDRKREPKQWGSTVERAL